MGQMILGVELSLCPDLTIGMHLACFHGLGKHQCRKRLLNTSGRRSSLSDNLVGDVVCSHH